jgi:hypothetical protein
MVVHDEAFLGAIDTFAAEQGAGMEALRISTKTSSMGLASVFLLLGASSISLMCMQ